MRRTSAQAAATPSGGVGQLLATGTQRAANLSRAALGLPSYSCRTCQLCFDPQLNTTPTWADRGMADGCDSTDCSEPRTASAPPRPPELPEWDALGLLHSMRGRTLAFVGDSLTQQHYTSMLCLLLASPGVSKPHIVRRTLDYKNFNSASKSRCRWKDCTHAECLNTWVNDKGVRLVAIGAHFPAFNFKVSFNSVNVLGDETAWGVHCLLSTLRKEDVLVANWGMWYNWQSTDPTKRTRDGVELVRAYQIILQQLGSRAEPPWTIFRETSPQHFDAPGGVYPGDTSEAGRRPCQDKPHAEMMGVGNWRNSLVGEFLQVASKHGSSSSAWPLLRVFESGAHMAHLKVGPRQPGKQRAWTLESDCTHWAFPSAVLDRWSYVLLAALVKREGVEPRWTGARAGMAEQPGLVLASKASHTGRPSHPWQWSGKSPRAAHHNTPHRNRTQSWQRVHPTAGTGYIQLPMALM